jgi:hypothetical protein
MAAEYTMPQNNLRATTDPTVSDDVTLGYSEGSPWINTATGFIFVLADPSAAAAVWQQVYPVALRVTTITADLTLTAAHTVVLCNAIEWPIVVTLPAASASSERLYTIIKIDSSANTVTINGADDIDPLTVKDEAVPIWSDGSNWRIPW